MLDKELGVDFHDYFKSSLERADTQMSCPVCYTAPADSLVLDQALLQTLHDMVSLDKNLKKIYFSWSDFRYDSWGLMPAQEVSVSLNTPIGVNQTSREIKVIAEPR